MSGMQRAVTEMERLVVAIKLAEAEGYGSDYQMWRRYRTTAENDAARQRMNDALEVVRLLQATRDNTVH